MSDGRPGPRRDDATISAKCAPGNAPSVHRSCTGRWVSEAVTGPCRCSCHAEYDDSQFEAVGDLMLESDWCPRCRRPWDGHDDVEIDGALALDCPVGAPA